MKDYKKKYEDALNAARKFKNDCPSLWDTESNPFKGVFEELEDSNDDNIGNRLLNWFKDCKWDAVDNGTLKRDDIIAWLEKQGKQKSQDKPALEVWKDMRLEVYQQASGNRHEPNYSDDSTKMFSLTDIDEIFEKITEKQDKQKPADKCIGCNNFKGCITCTDGNQYAHITEQKTTDKIEPKKELKKIEQTYFQKQEWTGYDEKAYEIALLDIDKSPSITKNDTINWLKSLKNRVQPQPKQEWSEEDERIFTLCALIVKTRYNDGLLTHYEYELASLWLESLKERMK